MNTEEKRNADAVIAFIEDQANRSVLETTDQFFSPQIVEAFADRQLAVDEVFARGETVIARILMKATHTGPFAGNAPTGKSVTVTQFREFKVIEGRIGEQRGWFDTGTLLPQLKA